MIKSILLKGIDEHARCILSGHIEGLLCYYKTAFPVFIRGEAKLINGKDELRAVLQESSARSRAAGVTRIDGHLIETRRVSASRYRCLVEWHYHSPDRAEPRVNAIVFFCSDSGGSIAVEMVEYRTIAFPISAAFSNSKSKAPQLNTDTPSSYLH